MSERYSVGPGRHCTIPDDSDWRLRDLARRWLEMDRDMAADAALRELTRMAFAEEEQMKTFIATRWPA